MKKVIVYSANWCGFCHSEMDWLKQNNIDFIKKDIEEDESAREELIQKMNGQFQGIPVTDVDGEIILGFDRAKLSNALNISRF